jgi:hypothetical protein
VPFLSVVSSGGVSAICGNHTYDGPPVKTVDPSDSRMSCVAIITRLTIWLRRHVV